MKETQNPIQKEQKELPKSERLITISSHASFVNSLAIRDFLAKGGMLDLSETLRTIEREFIVAAHSLVKTNAAAARKLGLNRTTYLTKIQRLGLWTRPKVKLNHDGRKEEERGRAGS